MYLETAKEAQTSDWDEISPDQNVPFGIQYETPINKLFIQSQGPIQDKFWQKPSKKLHKQSAEFIQSEPYDPQPQKTCFYSQPTLASPPCEIIRQQQSELPESENQQILFHSSQFPSCSSPSFQLLLQLYSQFKVYGNMLVDQWGRIMWCDKIAHEHFEGSLNNFQKLGLKNLFLEFKADQFVQQVAAVDHHTTSQIYTWLVYSKNNKRRYSNLAMPANPSITELYYRFIKCLKIRVRPIYMGRPSFYAQGFQAFCNEQLFRGGQKKCFLIQIRPSSKQPELDLKLFHDRRIKKFMKNILAKSGQRQISKKSTKVARAQLSESTETHQNDNAQSSVKQRICRAGQEKTKKIVKKTGKAGKSNEIEKKTGKRGSRGLRANQEGYASQQECMQSN